MFLLLKRRGNSKLSKKICFIVTDAISFNILCKGQLEYFRDHSDFDITLICGGSKKELDVLRERKVGKVIDAKFKRKPSLVQDTKSLMFLIQYLWSNNFDLIVYSTPKALLLGSIASSFSLGSKTVAIVHGRVYENFIGLKKLIFQNFDKVSFKSSNKVLFVSKSLLQKYIDEEIIDNRTGKVIEEGSFNGVNIDVFQPVNLEEKLNLRAKLELPINSFLICIVGRLCIDKGIKDIRSLAEGLKNTEVQFVFVGAFEDELSKEIVREIAERGQGYYIPHTTKVHEIFQASDLHLFLSYREGFGNVAIEAASCGIPTFSYDVVGVRDSVCNSISGQRFKFHDVTSIVEEIKDAVKDSSFSFKYIDSRKWVIDNFEQHKVWKNYLNFYLQSL